MFPRLLINSSMIFFEKESNPKDHGFVQLPKAAVKRYEQGYFSGHFVTSQQLP